MMKSFIIAATSIACILSLSNIAAAGERHQDSHSNHQLNLIKEKTDTLRSIDVPKKDLKGIEKAITEFYKNKNQEPQAPSVSGAHRFYEAKEISITAFDNNSAVVKVVEVEQIYSFRAISTQLKNGRYKYEYDKLTSVKPVIREQNFSLLKEKNKWIFREGR